MDYKVVQERPPDKTVSVEDWLKFLQQPDDTGKILYKKNIRSVEDARMYAKSTYLFGVGDKKYIIYPDVININNFNVYIFMNDGSKYEEAELTLEFDNLENKLYIKTPGIGVKLRRFVMYKQVGQDSGTRIDLTYDINDLKNVINTEVLKPPPTAISVFPTGGFGIPAGGFEFPTGGFEFPTGGFGSSVTVGQGGGRRRSRKAKKNKALSPQ